jgi:hypothetical protein
MNLTPIRANMTELDLGNVRILFSYRTPVACIEGGIAFKKTAKKWSNTTSRHISTWFKMQGNVVNVNEYPQEYFDTLIAGDVSPKGVK